MGRSILNFGRGLCCWLLVSYLAGSAAALPGAADLREILHRRGPKDRSRGEVLHAMVELGPAAIPELYRLYTGVNQEGFFQDPPEGGWWGRPDSYSELALEALSSLPREPLFEHLLGRGEQAEERLQIARIVGTVGHSSGIPILMRLIVATPELELRSRALRGAFVDAIRSVLRGEAASVQMIIDEVHHLDPRFALLIAEAASAMQRPEAVRLLTAMIGRWPEVDALAARAVGDLDRRFAWHLLHPEAELRELLASMHGEVRAGAAMSLAALGELDAVPEIIGLLEDTDRASIRAASAALCRMSGRSNSATASDWRTWHTLERAWWEETGSLLLLATSAEDPESISRAVRDLSQHPWTYPRLADRLGRLLSQVEAEAVPGLCRTLARLDSLRAVPGLLDALGRSDPAARVSAAKTLSELTGEDLSVEAEAWRTYLEG